MKWRGHGREESAEVHEHLAFLHAATVRIGGDLDLTQVVTALCEAMVPRVADLAGAYLYEAVLTDGELPELPGAPAEAVLRLVTTASAPGTHGHNLIDKIVVSDLTGPFAS
ncbi:MAG: hypothetical protein ACRDP6_12055, partial [Actinoallomurus sp.]